MKTSRKSLSTELTLVATLLCYATAGMVLSQTEINANLLQDSYATLRGELDYDGIDVYQSEQWDQQEYEQWKYARDASGQDMKHAASLPPDYQSAGLTHWTDEDIAHALEMLDNAIEVHKQRDSIDLLLLEDAMQVYEWLTYALEGSEEHREQVDYKLNRVPQLVEQLVQPAFDGPYAAPHESLPPRSAIDPMHNAPPRQLPRQIERSAMTDRVTDDGMQMNSPVDNHRPALSHDQMDRMKERQEQVKQQLLHMLDMAIHHLKQADLPPEIRQVMNETVEILQSKKESFASNADLYPTRKDINDIVHSLRDLRPKVEERVRKMKEENMFDRAEKMHEKIDPILNELSVTVDQVKGFLFEVESRDIELNDQAYDAFNAALDAYEEALTVCDTSMDSQSNEQPAICKNALKSVFDYFHSMKESVMQQAETDEEIRALMDEMFGANEDEEI